MMFRYDELGYAEYIEKNGFLTKYHTYELKILGKYYKSKGLSKKQIKETIYNFCEKHIEGFNKVLYFRKINSIVNYSNKCTNQLIVIKQIPITESEFEYINNLDLAYDYKKVVFTLLVRNKLNKEITKLLYNKSSEFNYFGGTNKHYKEILDCSNIKSKYKINKIINILHNKKIVEVRTRGKIKLSFIDNISNDENIKFNVFKFGNIGYCFDFYNGVENIIKCENCGKYIKQNIHNQKYCDECARDINKEKTKERMKNLRMFEAIDS